jgi:gas vesicle protein
MFGFLIGIAVGGLVGATLALLFAPESGTALRGELRARGMNFFGEIQSAAEQRRIELQRQLEDLRAPRG